MYTIEEKSYNCFNLSNKLFSSNKAYLQIEKAQNPINMIKFINNNESPPYLEFRKRYEQAINRNQPFIEAISISSFCKKNNQVDSRFVNLKYIDNKKFIFFTNYNSPKSMQFEGNNKAKFNIFGML